NDTGIVRCGGTLQQAIGGSSFDLQLNFTGDDIVLEDELRDALPFHAQCLWNEMKPQGKIKLILAKVNYKSGDQHPTVVTTIAPAGESVSIYPSFFPYRVERMKGQLTLENGKAEFSGLSAVHNR